jgi:multidrug efflux pump subunit AcrA (membrane-fusion protein)
MFQGLPRWLVAFGIVFIVAIEIAARLPDIVLLPQRLQGTAGEQIGKSMQPQLNDATIAKALAEARLADTQGRLNAELAAKATAETKVAQLQQSLTMANAQLAQSQAQLAQSQARLADTQAGKEAAETRVSQLRQYLTVAQAQQAEAQTRQADAQAAQANAEATKTTMGNIGTAATVGGLILGGLYVAKQAGWLPESSGSSYQSSQTSSPPTPAQRRATVTSPAANIRSCGGTRCDIVNRGDPITKGTEVAITGDAVLDDAQYQWFPVSATTGTATYTGFISSSILAVE